ncbi:hypothetical protein [Ponticaulis sp.]|uniref:hypothetical protein n=1 Tax=Ponticaulis sp. TaxID=2020902 RepID=UPI000C5AC3C6|nr:hypothetical protein [Ponticaulis sp.]MBN05845.1 hypothetical protein [Ponticaulis sp.]
MSLANIALCAAVLTGLPALAQANNPDCNSPSAVLFQTCAPEPEPEVSEEITNELSELAAAAYAASEGSQTTDNLQDHDEDLALRWGQMLSFNEDNEQVARRVTSVDIITVTLSDGQKVPYVETVFENGSTEERSPTLAETDAWREAISRDPDLERMPLDPTASAAPARRFPIQRPANETSNRSVNSGSEFDLSNWRVDTRSQSSSGRDDNPARDRLEERLEIPESRRGRDGRQCSEYESPDGTTRSSSCSQTWSWSSED